MFGKNIKQAIKLKDDYSLSQSYRYKGRRLWEESKYEDALENFSNALQIYKQLDSGHDIMMTLNNIGFVYTLLGMNQKAIETFTQVKIQAQEIQDISTMEEAILLLGIEYSFAEEFDKALEIFIKQLSSSNAKNYTRYRAWVNACCGYNYYYINDYKKANKYSMTSYDIYLSIGIATDAMWTLTWAILSDIKMGKLDQQKDRLIEESATKKLLVSNKKDELESVNSTKDEKQKLVTKLSKSEKLFKKRLQDKQKQAKELDKRIRKIIDEAIRKAREEAKKRNGNDNFSLTPEALALSSEFANNKGKLPWPLEKGVIISKYGKQKHSVFSGVETFNNGIDIATDKNMIVRVIFDGTVSRIFFIKGEGKAVLINHGEYFSVYSGLKEVSVKTGDKLLSKEKIGVVITNEQENKTELHFEIWKEYDKHDPSNWLYKAY